MKFSKPNVKHSVEQDFFCVKVTDVTKIQVDYKKLYLSAVMDLHDNYIVGYHLSKIQDVKLVEDSLLYALEIRKVDEKLSIHSDRGMPYRSNRWNELMVTYNLTQVCPEKLIVLNTPDNYGKAS
ncbi:hypothetical protein BTR23_11730 [Alkalihalophilus pseudofirmus]|nr:hypothetical protein BTR23_11730 [Alkalihalophilus pseudofirmus]